jgi:hypothetical protein
MSDLCEPISNRFIMVGFGFDASDNPDHKAIGASQITTKTKEASMGIVAEL